MVGAWMWLVPAGVLTAVYKHKFGPGWIKLHATIQTMVPVISLVSKCPAVYTCFTSRAKRAIAKRANAPHDSHDLTTTVVLTPLPACIRILKHPPQAFVVMLCAYFVMFFSIEDVGDKHFGEVGDELKRTD
jgi:hypothetical protein